ncbi:MAG: hypothetical protein OXH84_06915 [Gammaproteobacteria bacterium]|nr:hypothetical protein [Gammaproteobacteria bacterium]
MSRATSFRIAVVLIVFGAILFASLAALKETANKKTENESASIVAWTYDAELELLRAQWVAKGYPDIPTTFLPQHVLDKFGIESKTVGPEIFYSTEVQDLMNQFSQSSERSSETYIVEPTEETIDFLNFFFGLEHEERFNICGTLALYDDEAWLELKNSVNLDESEVEKLEVIPDKDSVSIDGKNTDVLLDESDLQ